MRKKNLLAESTVRQFMKYANISGLAEGFIQEEYEEEEEEALGGEDFEEPGLIDDPALDVDGPPVDDEPVVDDEPSAATSVDIESFMAAFEKALDDQGIKATSVLGDVESTELTDVPADADEFDAPEDGMGDFPPDEEEELDFDGADRERLAEAVSERIINRLRKM
jgi:hypothetical protein